MGNHNKIRTPQKQIRVLFFTCKILDDASLMVSSMEQNHICAMAQLSILTESHEEHQLLYVK